MKEYQRFKVTINVVDDESGNIFIHVSSASINKPRSFPEDGFFLPLDDNQARSLAESLLEKIGQ